MKTDDVRERMGAYKQFTDVPTERRLERFISSYDGRDVWEEYVASEERSESAIYQLGLVKRRWKGYMSEAGRHHALADPDHVEGWATSLLDQLSMTTAYSHYWLHVNRFYRWLMWHTKHPHVYNPVWMAVDENPEGAAGALWNKGRDKLHAVRRKQ